MCRTCCAAACFCLFRKQQKLVSEHTRHRFLGTGEPHRLAFNDTEVIGAPGRASPTKHTALAQARRTQGARRTRPRGRTSQWHHGPDMIKPLSAAISSILLVSFFAAGAHA